MSKTPEEENKDNLVDTIFKESCLSLMAHTIRGVVNHFHKKGIQLDVIVSRDIAGAIYRHAPKKASILKTSTPPKELFSPYFRVRAHIFVRKDANHNLSRLCIAHELYHLLIALGNFIAGGRKEWDGVWKSEDEGLCNSFAQELCGKHNIFNSNAEQQKNRVIFPPELFESSFILDLSDVSILPDCLKIEELG